MYTEVCCVLTESVEVRDCTPRHPAPGDVSGPEGGGGGGKKYSHHYHTAPHTHTAIIIIVNSSQRPLEQNIKVQVEPRLSEPQSSETSIIRMSKHLFAHS